MKTKRIVALVLCAVLACLSLVGCGENIDWLKEYNYQPEVIQETYFDFYIVVGEGSQKMAKESVNSKLNQIFSDEYNTRIAIHFIETDDYVSELQTALNSTADVTNMPKGYHYGGKIILINDYAMLENVKIGEGEAQQKLADVLAPLDSYLATNAFGKLNTQIAASLLASAKKTDNGTLAIPNNRRVGEYTYLVVNRDLAENVYGFSAQTEIPAMTAEDVNAFKELVAASSAVRSEEANGDIVYKVGDAVLAKITKGNYEDKATLEDGGKWMCNVSKLPEATVEMAYASAFGIIPGVNLTKEVEVKVEGQPVMQTVVTLDCVARAMEIIYAINTNVTVRNTLQYGVENTNFTLNDNGFIQITNSDDSNYAYHMDLIYTGDVLKAYYQEGVWTPDMADSIKRQNNESVIAD